jgi:hypothetical protein
VTVILKREGFERVETIDSTVPPEVISKKLNGFLVRFHLQVHSKVSDIAVYTAA